MEDLLEAYHRIEPAVQAGSGRPYREVMAETLRRLAGERRLPLDEAGAGALAEALPSWRPFPEVPGALRELRRRGWRLAVLSNTDPDLVAASLDRVGVPVDLVVTAAEAGGYKPAPGHWRRFREVTGAGPERHVHVAASLFHDIGPAAALGVPAVWINRAGDVTNRLDGRVDLPRAADLPDLASLPEALERIRPAGR